MRLVGSAALWYQTMQTAISTMSWETFVTTLCNRFDKDEHNHLIRHFFHIKQTTCVTEYVEQFSDLVHQILAHDPTFPQTIITNHFLDGLKKDIRAVIMVHRPQDLDTASSLALLQEEAMQDQVTKRIELGSYSKKTSSEAGKSSVSSITNPTRVTEDKKGTEPARSKTSDEKLSSLKQYRRAKGLCFKCGENGAHNINVLLLSHCMPWKNCGIVSLMAMSLNHSYTTKKILILGKISWPSLFKASMALKGPKPLG
jgi:hypothetical protein